jgi:hypothetical protein
MSTEDELGAEISTDDELEAEIGMEEQPALIRVCVHPVGNLLDGLN